MPTYITAPGWKLCFQATLQPVPAGARLKDFREEEHIVKGGRPPITEGSTGRIYTIRPDAPSEALQENAYYPSILGLTWVKES